MFDAGTA